MNSSSAGMATKAPSRAQSSAQLKIFAPVPAPRLRMICCAYAGGSAAVFRGWHERLPRDVEVCAVELPGRGARFREPPLRTMRALADDTMVGLLDCADADIVLFGHSMGGVLALELAKRLVDAGRPPLALVASGCAAPHLPSRRRRRLHDLPRDELVQELDLLQGLPAGMLDAQAFIDMFLPTIRADLESRETWRTEIRALPVPIHVLSARHDALVWTPDLGEWQRYSELPLNVRLFDGEHFFIDTHRPDVLAHLSGVLDALPAVAEAAADRAAAPIGQ
ncbi:thioesterase II family protein [Burkholderia stagnalis]|uniref:thioesterase II family protein n=2 Tax=Burkholderia stagnalis TaxID=1503054 RepID=UPI001E45FD1A|nr:alpha/beta fold hydrolase [Burkholderia stagnalis]